MNKPVVNQQLIEKAKGYLEKCQDERKFNPLSKTKAFDVQLPQKAGLAKYLKISRETLNVWDMYGQGKRDLPEAQDPKIYMPLYEQFSEIVEEVMASQEERLVNNGLGGSYNPIVTKLMLGKHDYSDKTDISSLGEKIQSNSIVFENYNEPES